MENWKLRLESTKPINSTVYFERTSTGILATARDCNYIRLASAMYDYNGITYWRYENGN